MGEATSRAADGHSAHHLSVGAEVLELDMGRQQALGKLYRCCRTISFGDNAVIVTEKNDVNRGLGVVYFYGNNGGCVEVIM